MSRLEQRPQGRVEERQCCRTSDGEDGGHREGESGPSDEPWGQAVVAAAQPPQPRGLETGRAALPISMRQSTGVSVTATTMDAAIANRYDSMMSGRNAPPSPRRKKTGMVAVAEISTA